MEVIHRKTMTVRALPIYKLNLCTYKAKGVPLQAAPMPDEEGSDVSKVALGMIEWLKQNNATADVYYLWYTTSQGEYKCNKVIVKQRSGDETIRS